MNPRSISIAGVVASLVITLLAVVAPRAQAAPFSLGVQDGRLNGGPAAVHEGAFTQLQSVGVGVTRLTLFWNTVAARCGLVLPQARLTNSDERCYDWTVTDRAVRLANERGIDVLISIYGAPAWASGSSDMAWVGDGARFTHVRETYADFAQAASARYSGGAGHGFVKYWTVWNEPNGPHFWKPLTEDSPMRYAELYASAAARIKAASPTSLVAPGPTAPNSRPLRPGDYIPKVQQRLAELGATGLVDAWAHNPYPGGNVTPYKHVWKLPSIGIGNIDDLFGLLDASPVTRGKPVWATEFAYQTNPPDIALGVSYAQQAQWMAEAMDVAWSTGRMPIFEWYILQDPTSDPAVDWDSGLFDASGAEKPAAAMFRRPVAVREMQGGRSRVWGRSGIDPGSGQLVALTPGAAEWKALTATKDENGVLLADVNLPDGTLVAVRDAAGLGPSRDISTAWKDVPRTTRGGTTTTSQAGASAIELRQKRVGARSFATACGKTLAKPCAYRRGQSRAALRADVRPGKRLHVRATWQRRTASGWVFAANVGHMTPSGAASFTPPPGVAKRAGIYRVRAGAATSALARPSAWQYLRLR